MKNLSNNLPDALRFFSEHLKLTGVAHTGPEPSGNPDLLGKRLGLLNGSSWITPWSNFFGRVYLPGVHLINAGNEAIQISFMKAHQNGLPVPPHSNIEVFTRMAIDLVELAEVDAILITCSTMNRSHNLVQAALDHYKVPVIQIDRPMMEKAILHGGKTLVVATHGPTVKSTQALLIEVAESMGQSITFSGLEVEDAWHCLASGDVERHNKLLANGIRLAIQKEKIDSVVLAQLSMTVFLLTYPDPIAEFGVPIFSSGKCGFEHMKELLVQMPQKEH
jgi:Asp/Glu/hydantoin racemase